MSDADISLSPTLDSVLRKYGKIWIWSILLAAISAFSIRSFASLGAAPYSTFPNRPSLDLGQILNLIVVLIPAIAVVFSMYYMLLFFRYHVLPVLFAPEPAAQPTEESPAETEPAFVPPDGAILLYRAFAAMVIAIALEIAAMVIIRILRLSF